jgi:N-acyl-D-amino-acid deacylase
VRQRLLAEMSDEGEDNEYGLLEVGTADGILLTSFRNPDLRHLTGKTLAEVAAMRQKPALEVAMDLVIEDDSRVGAVFFTMSEENVRKKVALPWVSFCTDSASLAPEGVFLNSNPHPRAYGSFARLLGKYVREEGIISLAEAVRRMAALPADVLRLKERGRLKPGYFADLAIFDPAKIQDNATFANPHQYATGMVHVLVNGIQVIKDGEHTGAMAGRVVKGPGFRG